MKINSQISSLEVILLFLVFQNKLKELKNQGILLCLITKNNSNDINLFLKKISRCH